MTFRHSLLLVCALALSPVLAAPLYDAIPTVENVRARLNLTAEQEAQLRPIFERRATELQQAKIAVEQASSRQQKRDAVRSAKASGKQFNSQVEAILSPTQRAEWRDLRSETREKIKERVEEKQSQR